MPQPICPYLGLSKDPGTVLEFPSERNYCHHTRPIAPVNLRHQRLACLSGKFVDCPVYKRAHAQPLPEDLMLPSFRQKRLRRLAMIVLFIVVLSGLGIGASILSRGESSLVFLAIGNSANSINQIEEERAASMALSGGGSVYSFVLTPTSTPTLDSTGDSRSCEPPGDWIAYIVKPTDSLVRLSLLYKVSVEQLQVANCLGGRVILRLGEIIFVPPPPTFTPTATRTATATRRPVIPPNPTSPPSEYVLPPSPTRPPPTVTPLPTTTSTPLPTQTPVPSPTLPPPPTPTNPPPLPTSTNPPPPPTSTTEPTAISESTVSPSQSGG